MRKVTFIIDDITGMRKLYKDNLTEHQFNDIMKDLEPFRVIFSLIGNKDPYRYELVDMEGNKLNINDLNGYQRGCVLNDCYKYFSDAGSYSFDTIKPFGVISITEEVI